MRRCVWIKKKKGDFISLTPLTLVLPNYKLLEGRRVVMPLWPYDCWRAHVSCIQLAERVHDRMHASKDFVLKIVLWAFSNSHFGSAAAFSSPCLCRTLRRRRRLILPVSRRDLITYCLSLVSVGVSREVLFSAESWSISTALSEFNARQVVSSKTVRTPVLDHGDEPVTSSSK